MILARQAAQTAVKRRIKREGRIKLSTLTAAHIARLAIEYLEAHPELIAEAAASPTCRTYKIRRPAQLKLLGPPLSWPNPNPDSDA